MKYLLDTNALVAMFRKQHNVREQILSKGIRNCAVSIVTIAELKVGAYKTNDYRQWKEVFETQNSFATIPIDHDTFDKYAQFRALLEKQGKKIDSLDLLIACSAIQNNMIVITHNKEHFDRIPGIQLEDWES